MTYFYSLKRNKEESEKSVLPAIIYINTNHKSFKDLRRKGFCLVLGWWDFSIKFFLVFD